MKVSSLYKALLCLLLLSTQRIEANDAYDPYKFSRDTRYQDPKFMWASWDKAYTTDGNFFSLGNAPVLARILEKHWQLARKKNDLDLMIKAAIPLSIVYHNQAKFNDGLPYFEFLYRNQKRIPAHYWKHILIMLEEEYRGTNEIEKAIHIRRLRIKLGYIKTFWEIYKECGLFEEALRDYLQFQQVPPPGDYRRLMYFQRLGWLYFDLKNYKKAYEAYTRGFLEVAEVRAKSKGTLLPRELDYWEGYFTGLKAQCKIEMGDYSRVIPMLQFDLRLSKDNPDTQIDVLILLARVYLHANQIGIAKTHLDRSRKLIGKKAVKMSRLHLLGVYSDFYAANKQYDSAYYYTKVYRSYLDTMNAHVNRNKSILLLGQLELAKHREESLRSKSQLVEFLETSKSQDFKIKFLSIILVTILLGSILLYVNFRQKGLLDQNQIQLDLEHERNAVLLKELHHRVKNNLQVIYSLLNLQKRRTKNKESIDLILALQNRIQTIALVHNNLFQSDDIEYVALETYVRTLVMHLHQMYMQEETQLVDVQFVMHDSIQLRFERIGILGLIINEIVSNAFKYAFDGVEKGVLRVEIVLVSQQIEVMIQDNGGGSVEEINQKSNLGMRLIRILSEQLGAHYDLQQKGGIKHLIKFNI
jgi:two-component sensor histidine kinase